MVGISNKEYKEVLENILTAQPVYVKDVGTKVLVTYYAKGDDRISDNKDHLCKVTFLELPSKKAVDKSYSYSVALEENNNTPSPLIGGRRNHIHVNGFDVYISAKIHIKDLRAVPFKGSASKLLYGKKK